MTNPMTGPRLPAKSGTTKQLVVFLHGYGADGKDLIEVGKQWQKLLPDAAFVSPNAPQPCAGSPMGRQWFPLTMRDPEERWVGAEAARPELDAFLDAELEAAGLDDAPAAIIGYSGVLVGPEHLSSATARTPKGEPPPILLIHGTSDDVIPVEALFGSAQQLSEAGIPTQWHMAAGLGHGIDGGGLAHGGMFLANAFGMRMPPR
jgi:phospholipase/carboxylesterase